LKSFSFDAHHQILWHERGCIGKQPVQDPKLCLRLKSSLSQDPVCVSESRNVSDEAMITTCIHGQDKPGCCTRDKWELGIEWHFPKTVCYFCLMWLSLLLKYGSRTRTMRSTKASFVWAKLSDDQEEMQWLILYTGRGLLVFAATGKLCCMSVTIMHEAEILYTHMNVHRVKCLLWATPYASIRPRRSGSFMDTGIEKKRSSCSIHLATELSTFTAFLIVSALNSTALNCCVHSTGASMTGSLLLEKRADPLVAVTITCRHRECSRFLCWCTKKVSVDIFLLQIPREADQQGASSHLHVVQLPKNRKTAKFCN
jgi:hypothetical protein